MYNFIFYDFLKINRKRTNRPLKWSVVCLTFLTLTTMSVNAQNVNIPDPNFKAYLVGNSEINTDGDDEISITEAQAFTGMLFCYNKNISDLTGIEAFVNITELNCDDNQLTTLDVSNLTNLEGLSCYNNQLTALDVSNNTALIWFDCSDNQLSSLDVSNNAALEELWCINNQLNVLDVSNNTALTWFGCSNNQLTSLDVSNNTALTNLYCDNNNLSSLDVSNNTALIEFYCNNNQLTTLNIKNGNNTNVNTFFLNLTNNPNLYCIEVDDVAYSNANWSNNKDATACFSENCLTPTFDLPTSVCQNTDVPVLEATSVNNISGSWSPATIDDSVIDTQTYTFTPTLCANSYQITISVVATPDTPTGDANQTFNAGQTLADLVVNGTNLVWSSSSTFSDTLSDNEPLVNGTTYYVRSENGNCQSDFLAITVTLTVNVSDFDIYEFRSYPNPVNDILTFSSNRPIENVVVTNMLGQQINVAVSSDKTNLDMSNLSSGNYFVKATIDGVAKMIKVVKR